LIGPLAELRQKEFFKNYYCYTNKKEMSVQASPINP